MVAGGWPGSVQGSNLLFDLLVRALLQIYPDSTGTGYGDLVRLQGAEGIDDVSLLLVQMLGLIEKMCVVNQCFHVVFNQVFIFSSDKMQEWSVLDVGVKTLVLTAPSGVSW